MFVPGPHGEWDSACPRIFSFVVQKSWTPEQLLEMTPPLGASIINKHWCMYECVRVFVDVCIHVCKTCEHLCMCVHVYAYVRLCSCYKQHPHCKSQPSNLAESTCSLQLLPRPPLLCISAEFPWARGPEPGQSASLCWASLCLLSAWPHDKEITGKLSLAGFCPVCPKKSPCLWVGNGGTEQWTENRVGPQKLLLCQWRGQKAFGLCPY